MRLADANILVNAFREDAAGHHACRRWLDAVVRSEEPFAVADSVLAGFLRIVTLPNVFKIPTPLAKALDFCEVLRSVPNAVPIAPGDRHWGIFLGLCRAADAKGNLIPDAWLAAVAIESGCELVTMDRDFARFQGLRWSTPTGRPGAR